MTIWRYGEALSQTERALSAPSQAALAQSASVAFWQQDRAMNEPPGSLERSFETEIDVGSLLTGLGRSGA